MTLTIDGNTVIVPADLEAQITELGGLREGIAQIDAGQGRPFVEFAAEVRAVRRVRTNQPDSGA